MRSVSTRNRRGIETEVRALRTRVIGRTGGGFWTVPTWRRTRGSAEKARRNWTGAGSDASGKRWFGKEFICSARRSFRKDKKRARRINHCVEGERERVCGFEIVLRGEQREQLERRGTIEARIERSQNDVGRGERENRAIGTRRENGFERTIRFNRANRSV